MSPTKQPYTKNQARKHARKAVEDGLSTYSQPHADERMKKRKISVLDVENVLRGGFSGDAEFENSAWRYKICTNKITVVVELWDDGRVFVVTAYRPK
jgi:Domain of unknown function (DUF4258)